jgi:hypothetical protein
MESEARNVNVEELKRLEEFEKRLNKLEAHGFEDTLTLVEILSSITFFGGLKMEKCKYAKEGQCGFFFLKNEAKKKIPMASDCRIKDCKGEPDHCHLELSNVTCAFCPKARIPRT